MPETDHWLDSQGMRPEQSTHPVLDWRFPAVVLDCAGDSADFVAIGLEPGWCVP
jgi:hypothetical protein